MLISNILYGIAFIQYFAIMCPRYRCRCNMAFATESEYILNFGPHHPSTHGVLRLIFKMRGETVVSCIPDIGYLHRGVEKIVESKKWLSIIPFLDRLDYLAPLHAEHAYALALEAVLNLEVPKRALYIRTIFDELTRISSHIMGLGCASHDIGMLSLFLYGFEEREKIMDIFEATTGARMHLNYYIPGGVFSDISIHILEKINIFLNGLQFYLDAVDTMALQNRVFKNRTIGVGVISYELAKGYGLTGPNGRASGIGKDLRKTNNYGAYDELSFDVLTMSEGDCYARFYQRVEEIKQSVYLIRQCLDKIPSGDIHNTYAIRVINNKNLLDNEIKEAVFSYFFENGFDVPKKSKVYRSVDGPRGEFGIFISTEVEESRPYRLHIRSPSFASLQILEELLVGSDIPDVTAILGSLDFVMGDCDR